MDYSSGLDYYTTDYEYDITNVHVYPNQTQYFKLTQFLAYSANERNSQTIRRRARHRRHQRPNLGYKSQNIFLKSLTKVSTMPNFWIIIVSSKSMKWWVNCHWEFATIRVMNFKFKIEWPSLSETMSLLARKIVTSGIFSVRFTQTSYLRVRSNKEFCRTLLLTS